MAIVVTVAFWGFVRLAEELDIGSLESRLAGGAIFALWPTFTILVAFQFGCCCSRSLDSVGHHSSGAGQPQRITDSGGCPIGGCSPIHERNKCCRYVLRPPYSSAFPHNSCTLSRKRSLIGWWVVCVGLATAWWIFPLIFLGTYGFNFLPFVEQSVTTTSTSSATTALDGTNVWLAYLNLDKLAWEQGAITIVSLPITIIGSGISGRDWSMGTRK